MFNTLQKEISNKHMQKLKIISVNVNSIVANQRRFSLYNLMNKHKPDIVFLSETKLRESHVVNFKDFNIIRDDRKHAQGGGTAIIMKKNISYKKIATHSTRTDSVLEHTIIKIKIGTNMHLYLIAAYATCGAQKEFIPELENLFKKLKLGQDNNYFVLAGDLNAKHTSWLNPNCNARGVSLDKWLKEREFFYKIKLYCTRFPSYPQGRSYLDVILADVRLEFEDALDGFKLPNVPYDSDHNAILTSIALTNNTAFLVETMMEGNKFNYKKADWNKFSSRLEELNHNDIPNNRNLLLTETIKHLENLDKYIVKAMSEKIPTIKPKNSSDSYVTPEITNLQKLKSHILTQLHNAQKSWPLVNEQTINILKKLLNIVRYRLKNEFKNTINKYWKEKIQNIPINDSSVMFPRINRIFRKKKQPKYRL